MSPFLLLVQNTMHCFSFSKRACAQKYARPRWLFKKFALHHHFHSPFIHYCFFGGEKAGAQVRENPRHPLWNAVLKSPPPEPPRRAYFPRRLWGEKGFFGVIMIRAGARRGGNRASPYFFADNSILFLKEPVWAREDFSRWLFLCHFIRRGGNRAANKA